MYKQLLKGINATGKLKTNVLAEPVVEEFKAGSEDEKCNSSDEETVMDYVNRTHDFTKISWEDLSAAFKILAKRCPKSWTQELENRAKSFHQKIMILRNESNMSKYIDPEKNVISSSDLKVTVDAKDLIRSPERWNMVKVEAGVELKELLYHLTTFAPFKGRPFVRAWLEALVPCLSHWILLSHSKNETVKQTLKHFLGAFGQDGIVVCLPDKGLKLLNSLKDAARAVEALGRGTVEQYYWKQLTEANCGGEAGWRELASIPSWSRDLSQLDTLPANWLLDSRDFAHVFANIVSPEISKRFEEILEKTFAGKSLKAKIKAGPPKTLARTIAKSHEYRAEYLEQNNFRRWSAFGAKFREVFGRSPENSEDFVWNIMDFARCSITVPSALEVLIVKEILEKSFSVVGVKNGYSAKMKVKGSGYRDFKFLIEAEFENLELQSVPQVEQKTKIICEVQIICETWLENKRTTSLSYKILRGANLREVLVDFSKYLVEKNLQNLVKISTAREVLKNGWRNLAKMVDFAGIDKDDFLFDAAYQGWNGVGIEMLVTDLNANIEASNEDNDTPLTIAAMNGHDKVVKTLVDLKSNLVAQNILGNTALHEATYGNRQACIRILLNAGASVELKNRKEETPLDVALKKHPNKKRLLKLLQGHHLPPTQSEDSIPQFNELKNVASEGSLKRYFDSVNVSKSVVSKLLPTEAVTAKVENILQVLWFGCKVDSQDESGDTSLSLASTYGWLTSVKILLDLGANVNLAGESGCKPLHFAVYNDNLQVVKTLIKANANIEAINDDGWTPLHVAAASEKNNIIPILLSAGANMGAKTFIGEGPLDLAHNSTTRMALRAGAELVRKVD